MVDSLCVTEQMEQMIPKSEIDGLSSENEQMFWIKLGRETCNICHWSFYCSSISSINYGKTDPHSKSLEALWHALDSIRSTLDDLLMVSYEIKSKEEHDFEAVLREYAQPSNNRTDKNLTLVNVFYSIANIERPNEIKRHKGRYPRNLVADDKFYIEAFLQRTEKYIRFIKANTEFFCNHAQRSRFCQKFAQNIEEIEKTQGKLSQYVFQLREIEEQ